jgi:hypothetical protein
LSDRNPLVGWANWNVAGRNGGHEQFSVPNCAAPQYNRQPAVERHSYRGERLVRIPNRRTIHITLTLTSILRT